MPQTNWILVFIQKDGRISIPKSLREYYGLRPGQRVTVKVSWEEETE